MMRILFIGDVGVLHAAVAQAHWPAPIQGDDRTRIILNWELPIGEVSTRYKPMQLAAPPGSIAAMQHWRGAVACLTNNHALDAGAPGLLGTVAALTAAGIEVFGYRHPEADACQVWRWEGPEGKLCVLAWVTPETTPIPGSIDGVGPVVWPGLDRAAEAVREAKRDHDWVAAYIHWDIELFSSPSPATRALAEGLAKAGADLIIGHHPHVVRGRESLDGVEVFYSLGNYYFDDLPPDSRGIVRHQVGRNRESIGVLATFARGQSPALEVISFYQERRQATQRDPSRRGEKRLRQASRTLASRRDQTYALWYGKALARFRRIEYRLQFRLLSLPPRSWLRLLGWRVARRNR